MAASKLVVCEDVAGAAGEAARRIARVLSEALAERGAAHLALAGGETPRPAYERLAGELGDWTGVEVWFGDERAVGADDPDSNFLMAKQALIDSGGPDLGQVHRIEGERGAEDAAGDYAAKLSAALPDGEGGVPVLDVAVQGLGPDAHTASLFPGNPAVKADGVCVPVHDAPKPPPDRITLTVPVLRAARRIIFLASGEGKRDAVAKLLAGPDPAAPASLLDSERTVVIVDAAAAEAPAEA